PSGSGPVESGRQTITTTNSAPQLGTHTIAYSYDPLYRLTGADYSGDISASYAYAYDAVGNMAAYTETLVTDSGTETSIVNRAFNDANQLTSATDTVLGTTSYYYDDNGNMTQILPPGVSADEAGELLYSFSQRNLLTSNRVSMGGGVTNIVATYGYDGSGNRIQQVDHSGDTPVTTTYTNDIMGLTQVLVADDGSQPVYSLLGLDPSTGSGRRLISQDDGTGMRTLLVDGLGSVRQEMAAGEVETTSTYNPYGTLLAQTGTSGTVYGYTGEQEDSATGLVYLRARYYNPALQVFMGKDPWRGDRMRPITQHGYVYGHNSPPNFNDPSGLCVPEGDNGECLPPDDYGLIEGLIDFQGVSGQKWSSAERYEVNKAARQIEKRLADTYNEYMYGFDLSAHVPENILHYVNCSPTDPPLTYIKAFLYFYGKPVLFYKTGTVNGDNAEAYGMYGTTPGGRGINVYRVAKITAEAYGYRWATHEMGHYFEARVNDILGVNSVRNTLGKYANEDLPLNIRIPRRGGDNDEVKYGFADTTYIWQFSDKATTGEEYADMFLGWNYNQWEMRDDNSGFTDLGQARSSFMERYMAPWIALVINRERK
ncbi:MAG: RHS repeat-associated core domain-containing protein, partial [Anaerolineae bacterium]|nr:RHS repeat-associated core domain-containing protein [Anaerolineae bacterium]